MTAPTADSSSVKQLVAMGFEPDDDPDDDELSTGDISQAFCKADDYGEDKPEGHRYVQLKMYRGGPTRVFKRRKPMYGQREAPPAWHGTVRRWLVDDMGFVQGKNDQCLFKHPNTGLRLALHVDDIMARGNKKANTEFWEAADKRFMTATTKGLKSWEFIIEGAKVRFCGLWVAKRRCLGRTMSATPILTMPATGTLTPEAGLG